MNEGETFTVEDELTRTSYYLGLWTQYTYKIKPNWDAQAITFSIDGLSKNRLESKNSTSIKTIDDNKVNIGHRFTFGLLYLYTGFSWSLRDLKRTNNNFAFGIQIFSLNLSLYYKNQNLNDEFLESITGFTLAYYF